MQLIFVYGPPAAGKLTVAEELARLTGYCLFHNHVSRDAVTAVLPSDAPEYTSVVRGVRLQLLRAAADARVPGVIFTFVFFRGEDEPFVDCVCDLLEERGGAVRFVQLACDRPTLELRVTNASRRRFGKLTDRAGLARVFAEHDVSSAIPVRASLCLDSASTGPNANARAIAAHYTLPTSAALELRQRLEVFDRRTTELEVAIYVERLRALHLEETRSKNE